MLPGNTQPQLRLVGSDDPPRPAVARQRAAYQRVAGENRAAATNRDLNPSDPRWVLAARASTQLQGSMLTLERRDRLMRLARQLGVRPFEANIIIAIVQDHARRGRRISEAAGTLALVDQPGGERSAAARWSGWARWVSALLVALTANALVIWWLTG